MNDSLSLFRALVNQFISNEQITSIQQWRQLMKHLCDNKIILPVDVRSIDQKILVFPMKYQNLERIIMQSKADPKLLQLLFDTQRLKDELSNCKSTLSVWKQQGLSKQQFQQLLSIYQKFKERISSIKNKLNNLSKDINETQQQHIQIIDNLIEFRKLQTIEQGYKNSFQYQQMEAYAIEKYFNSIRVREINYRNQPIKVFSNKNGIIRQLGYNTKNDEPLQIIKISKMYNDFYKLQIMLSTFNSLKQLVFSPYFPNFLGYNNYSDPASNQYFMQYYQSKSLQFLLSGSKYRLFEEAGIYQYWIRQIFYGFKDLLYMSTYMPILPITISTLHISEKGLRILFKNIQFARKRKGESQNHQRLQSKLLRNYALICLEMIGLNEQSVDSIKNIDFKCLIKALLYAQKQQFRFEKGVSTKKFTFELCNFYPVLSTKNLEDIEPCLITKNYETIFENSE